MGAACGQLAARSAVASQKQADTARVREREKGERSARLHSWGPLHLCFEGIEAHVSLQIASLVYWHGFHSIQLQMLSTRPERLRDPKTLNPNKRRLAPLILLSLVILH